MEKKTIINIIRSSLNRGWLLYSIFGIILAFSLNFRAINIKVLNGYNSRGSYLYLFNVARNVMSNNERQVLDAIRFYRSYFSLFKEPSGEASLAYAYFLMGRYKKALDIFLEIKKRYPNDIGIFYNVMVLRSLLDQWGEVKKDLSGFIECLKGVCSFRVRAAAIIDPEGEMVAPGYKPLFLQEKLDVLSKGPSLAAKDLKLFYYLPPR